MRQAEPGKRHLPEESTDCQRQCLLWSWSPPESELQLLGDLGRKVREIGCWRTIGDCAGEARAGVTGIDISDAQLKFARQLAQKGVSVHFMQSDAQQLSVLPTIHTLRQTTPCQCPMADDLSSTPFNIADRDSVTGCHQLLSNNGRLVTVSIIHAQLFIDEEENELALPVRDYFDTTPLASSSDMALMVSPIGGQWLAALCKAGWLLQLVEPPLVAGLPMSYGMDGAQAALRNLPHADRRKR